MLDLVDSNLKPIFLRMYFSLVETFNLKLLKLHLIKHGPLGFNIYHLRLQFSKWASNFHFMSKIVEV